MAFRMIVIMSTTRTIFVILTILVVDLTVVCIIISMVIRPDLCLVSCLHMHHKAEYRLARLDLMITTNLLSPLGLLIVDTLTEILFVLCSLWYYPCISLSLPWYYPCISLCLPWYYPCISLCLLRLHTHS